MKGINARVIYTSDCSTRDKNLVRRLFLKEVAIVVVKPHALIRSGAASLSNNLVFPRFK